MIIPKRKGSQDSVNVIVIDSLSATLSERERFLSQFSLLSHGEAVSSLAGPSVDQIYNVDDAYGEVDVFRYIDALRDVDNWTGSNSRRRLVVNISLCLPIKTREEYSLIRRLYNKGVIIVASAGNDGADACKYPAAYDEVISVAACDIEGIAGYSNNCKSIDIVAYGEYKETRTRTDGPMQQTTETVILHGTSFSAPRVSSIVVDMLKIKPSLTKDEIVEILQKSAAKVNYSRCAGGKVNRLAALAQISAKHKTMLNIKNIFMITITVLSGLLIAALALYFGIFFIIIPFSMYVFRLFLPGTYTRIQKHRLKKMMSENPNTVDEIKKIVKILICQDEDVEEAAKENLISLSKKSEQIGWRVLAALKQVLVDAKMNDFIDERKPIEDVKYAIEYPTPQ